MSTNNFYSISSSLEDEELELSFIELEPWLENEAMKYKWENPSTSEKWKNKNKWEVLPLICRPFIK